MGAKGTKEEQRLLCPQRSCGVGCIAFRYERLLEIQAMLLQRSMKTADILRQRLINAKLPVDHPPDSLVERIPAAPDPELPELPDAEPELPRLPDIDPGDTRTVVAPASEMTPREFTAHRHRRHRDVVGMTIEVHAKTHAADNGSLRHVHRRALWLPFRHLRTLSAAETLRSTLRRGIPVSGPKDGTTSSTR